MTDKPSPTSTFSGEVDWVLLFFRCFFSGFNCVFMFFLLCFIVLQGFFLSFTIFCSVLKKNLWVFQDFIGFYWALSVSY